MVDRKDAQRSLAERMLDEELDGRRLDFTHAEHVPAAALELLRMKRAAWPAPGDGGAEVVTAFAAAVFRLRGHGYGNEASFHAVRRALRARVLAAAGRVA